MYKLLAIDLDGTLLNSKGCISEINKKALKELTKKTDIEIVFNSGRQITTVENFAKQIENINYCICGNGSIIYDIKNNKKIYTNFLDKKDTLEIIKFCKKNDIYYNVYTEDDILVESLQHNILSFYKQNKELSKDIQLNIKIKDDVYKYIEENNVNILKIGISHSDRIKLNKIFKELNNKEIDLLPVEGVSRKSYIEGKQKINIEYFYTEAIKKNSNKGYSLRKLVKYLNINLNDIVAIGDNINDSSMIKDVGLGIALGNSTPSIMKIAKAVTLDNDNNGVAYAINKYIINNE